MQALIQNMFKQLNATLNRDRSRDLFKSSHCEDFEHKSTFLLLILLYTNGTPVK
jgi:hypothetical protein